jgi:myosin-3
MKKSKLDDYAVGKTKVFLKHFHAEQLAGVLRQHRQAYIFVEKVCRGFIARQRFRVIIAAKRKMDADIAAMLKSCEEVGKSITERFLDQNDFDIDDKDNREWLKSQAERERLEAERKAKEDAEKAKADAEREANIKKVPTVSKRLFFTGRLGLR